MYRAMISPILVAGLDAIFGIAFILAFDSAKSFHVSYLMRMVQLNLTAVARVTASPQCPKILYVSLQVIDCSSDGLYSHQASLLLHLGCFYRIGSSLTSLLESEVYHPHQL